MNYYGKKNAQFLFNLQIKQLIIINNTKIHYQL